ncbi:hypothetical protein BN2475_1070027 [Paraburkholderia ribeironis]|uniref:Uncharacterized protein n=1 Tax=Paraburkholderia ribeironis TaxID=1247936 RepID=A0A1N7SMN9_9BURK|nr:hypothetical protein BN2475_1070027 [Paraburkholderia ribeironis]
MKSPPQHSKRAGQRQRAKDSNVSAAEAKHEVSIADALMPAQHDWRKTLFQQACQLSFGWHCCTEARGAYLRGAPAGRAGNECCVSRDGLLRSIAAIGAPAARRMRAGA